MFLTEVLTSHPLPVGLEVNLAHMSAEESNRLLELMIKLQTLPTPELIAESARLRCPEPLTDATKRRFRNQLAGAFAAQTVYAYVASLQGATDVREQIGRSILELRDLYRKIREREANAAVAAKIQAMQLVSEPDAMFHFFAICGTKFYRLLPIAASSVSHNVADANLETLEGYEHLRHYYEHLENEFPGKKNSLTAVSETESPEGWTISMGLPRDSQGRLKVRASKPPHNVWTVDVSRRGMDEVLRIVERELGQIRNAALLAVREHFQKNLRVIPPADTVNPEVLVRLHNWDES